MKILVLSKYSRKGASSRYRMYQYFPGLLANGILVECAPLFNDEYLHRLYSGKSRLWSVITAYIRRALSLLKHQDADVVWVEKELFPWVPWFIESVFFKILGKAYVVDYDDAIFHQYDQHRMTIARSLLGTKCDSVMRNSAAVIAGNEYLAERARKSGAKAVFKIPTVVAGQVFAPKKTLNQVPVIGWIGSMSTAPYLQALRPALAQLTKKYSFKVRIVGAVLDWPDVPVENVLWTEQTEVSSVQSFDIGIMPLIDSPWERGKCGFKLVQYMACGKPVVADPVGVNAEIVQDTINGYLTSATRSWYEALEVLLVDAGKREAYGIEGRNRFEQCYSLECWEQPLRELFNEVVLKAGQK